MIFKVGEDLRFHEIERLQAHLILLISRAETISSALFTSFEAEAWISLTPMGAVPGLRTQYDFWIGEILVLAGEELNT